MITGDPADGFTVTNKRTPPYVPKTGDENNLRGWLAALFLSFSGMLSMAIEDLLRRKKRSGRNLSRSR